MKKHKITIITVTKNSEKYLNENINSILSQNYDNYEPTVIRKIALKTYGNKSYANKIRNEINSVLLARD